MKYVVLFFLILLSFSCEDITKLNQNTKNPRMISGDFLFTSAQKNLIDQVVETDVNQNIFRLIMQYWQQVTYVEESRYNIKNRAIPQNIWISVYRDALQNFNKSYDIISTNPDFPAGPDKAEVKANKLALIEIMTVYAYAMMVDIFGDVPYTLALDDKNLLPKYDDAKTIYENLLVRLDEAISDMTPGEDSFGVGDNIYGGDVKKWILFANSLKLRMAIILSDVNASLAKTAAEAA